MDASDETERILRRRRDKYDEDDLSRLDVLERTVFGFADKNSNVWIPGMLQVLANGDARTKRIERWGLVLGLMILGSLNMPVLRELAEAIGRMFIK